MAKNILDTSKSAKIAEKIKVLEVSFNKPGNTLGKDAGLGNGTVDGWTDNQIDKPNAVVEKFLKHYNINPVWWRTGEGEVFLTPAIKSTGSNEIPEVRGEVYRTIVEGETEYILMARSVLQEKYRLVAIEQLNHDKATIDKLLDQIEKLQGKLLGLGTGVNNPVTQKAK
jgi:hypothetical protein